jgi:glycosyltransferase involved in cell wall biosynthesis
MDVVADGKNGLLCHLTAEDFAKGLREVLGNPDRLFAMRAASLEKSRDFSLPDRLNDYERALESAAR